jgi:hypothetical protein
MDQKNDKAADNQQQQQQHTSESSITLMRRQLSSTSSFVESIFFKLLYAPTGQSGLQIGALFRIGFAIIVLYDRIIMIDHMDFFFDPDIGVLTPYSAMPNETVAKIFAEEGSGVTRLPITSLFQYFSVDFDPILVKTLHYGSIIQASLLLVGVYPRLMVLCIHISIISFQNRSINMIYDNQDMLFLAMSFYMLFLPLHHWSLPQYLRLSFERTTNATNCPKPSIDQSSFCRYCSWPIWPFRLIQWQMCAVMMGAGIGKLSFPIWRQGWAIYNVIHQQDFFGGIFAPDWMYNVTGVLQVLTIASLILECTCWIAIWPAITRKFVVVNMLLFHLGIDFAMNIHIFHWLSILGWCSFLVEPDNSNNKNPVGESKGEVNLVKHATSTPSSSFARMRHLVVNIVFPLMWLFVLVVETTPVFDMYRLTKEYQDTIWPILSNIVAVQDEISERAREVFLEPLGLKQKIWNMYSKPGLSNSRIVAKISFDGEDVEDTYWISTEWTKLSVFEKKHMYRQVLFWNSLHFEPIIQHALCKRLAKMFETDDKGAIQRIVIKELSVQAPSHSRIRKSRWMDPARQSRLVNLQESVLYVYNPTTIPGEGATTLSDPEDDFDYIWDDLVDGLWWDDVFYAQIGGRSEYILLDYPYHDELESRSESQLQNDGSRTDEAEL